MLFLLSYRHRLVGLRLECTYCIFIRHFDVLLRTVPDTFLTFFSISQSQTKIKVLFVQDRNNEQRLWTLGSAGPDRARLIRPCLGNSHTCKHTDTHAHIHTRSHWNDRNETPCQCEIEVRLEENRRSSKKIFYYTLNSHFIRYIFLVKGSTHLCLYDCLTSSWHTFIEVLETVLRKFGPYWYDDIMQLLQMYWLLVYDVNLPFRALTVIIRIDWHSVSQSCCFNVQNHSGSVLVLFRCEWLDIYTQMD